MRITNTGEVAIGATTAGARLDVRAQGALSTDIAFRVRNSADTANLMSVDGLGKGVFSNDISINGIIAGRGNFANSTNTVFGALATNINTGGYWTTAFGYQSLTALTTGIGNTSIGYNSGLAVTTGNYNICIGHASGAQNSTGDSNISIGAFSDNGGNFTNSINIGRGAIALGSNTVVLGNSSITLTALRGNIAIGATTAGARLDVRAQGALSTDIAFRVRNSADTANLLDVRGNGMTTIIGGADGGINNGVLVVQNTSPWSGFQWLQTWKNSANTTVASLNAQGGFSTAATISGLSLNATSGGNATFRAISVNSTSGFYGSTGIRFVTNNLDRAGFTNDGNFVIGTTTDIASAILNVNSTTQGFLPPRMTNAQRLAIASPAIGLMVYCTDVVEGVYVNTSTGWKSLTMV
jgi:hypothetical protein